MTAPDDRDNPLEETQKLLAEHRSEEALKRLEGFLREHPGDRRALNLKARVHARRGEITHLAQTALTWMDALEEAGLYALAEQAGRAVLRWKPDSVEARLRLVGHFEKRREPAKMVETAREFAPFLLDAGQGDLAVMLLLRARKADPENPVLATELADVYITEGHLSQAAELLEEVGLTYRRQGETEQARQIYERLKVLEPRNLRILQTVADLYAAAGDYDRAVKEYRAALRLDFNHAGILHGLARASHGKGSLGDAVLAYRKLVGLQPDNPTLFQELAQVYFAHGVVEQAALSLLGAARAARRQGDRRQAEELYRSVLEVQPDHPMALRELKELLEASPEPVPRTPAAKATALVTLPPPPAAELPAPPPPAPESIPPEAVLADAGPQESVVLLEGPAPLAGDRLTEPPEERPRKR